MLGCCYTRRTTAARHACATHLCCQTPRVVAPNTQSPASPSSRHASALPPPQPQSLQRPQQPPWFLWEPRRHGHTRQVAQMPSARRRRSRSTFITTVGSPPLRTCSAGCQVAQRQTSRLLNALAFMTLHSRNNNFDALCRKDRLVVLCDTSTPKGRSL